MVTLICSMLLLDNKMLVTLAVGSWLMLQSRERWFQDLNNNSCSETVILVIMPQVIGTWYLLVQKELLKPTVVIKMGLFHQPTFKKLLELQKNLS